MIPRLDDAVLDSVSRTISDVLTGTIITNVFGACGIADTSGESTKWKRIYFSFCNVQAEDRCADRVGAFIEAAMNPSRWTSDGLRGRFDEVREGLNRALVFAGLELGADGKLKTVKVAVSLDEAHERANRLRNELQRRNIHPAVLAACSRLLLKDDNYFHAAFEATKSLAVRLREMSGSGRDGNPLVDETLECGQRPYPIVALNSYDGESLKNEQKGIAHLARGLFYAFRNVTAHEPAHIWTISEQDALDMMSTASLIHRRLDLATVTTALQPQPP
ncbi:MAG: TIGR02391 family protein [Firmicutes bacterium]|nr:TIGR02391 family protein [Bacillota bacterium]